MFPFRRENLKLLLRFDPTCVDLVDNEGNSPTHLAAMLHNKKIIKILMVSCLLTATCMYGICSGALHKATV